MPTRPHLIVLNRGPVQSWSQTGVNVQSYNASSYVSLTYKLTCANGDSAAEFTLTPQGDKWLIQSFNFRG